MQKMPSIELNLGEWMTRLVKKILLDLQRDLVKPKNNWNANKKQGMDRRLLNFFLRDL